MNKNSAASPASYMPPLDYEVIALEVLDKLSSEPFGEGGTPGEEAALLSEAQCALLTTDWWAGEQALIIPPREELMQSLAKIFQAIAIGDALARKPTESAPEALP